MKRKAIPKAIRDFVMKRDASKCVYCGDVAWKGYGPFSSIIITLDHLIPHSKGGLDQAENLVCCCLSCNMSKNGRIPEEWGYEPSFFEEGVEYSFENNSIVKPIMSGLCPEITGQNPDVSIVRAEQSRVYVHGWREM